jgi:hypothetical protein
MENQVIQLLSERVKKTLFTQNSEITTKNQVWTTDPNYTFMNNGFMILC